MITIAIHSHLDYGEWKGAPMYICICNAIREKDLRQAALTHAGDADSVYAALGHQPQCGQCLDDAARLLVEERARAQLPDYAQA